MLVLLLLELPERGGDLPLLLLPAAAAADENAPPVVE